MVQSLVFFIILLKCVVNCEFSHEWAVQIHGGDENVAKDIAHRNNFEYLGKVSLKYINGRSSLCSDLKKYCTPSRYFPSYFLQKICLA